MADRLYHAFVWACVAFALASLTALACLAAYGIWSIC